MKPPAAEGTIGGSVEGQALRRGSQKSPPRLSRALATGLPGIVDRHARWIFPAPALLVMFALYAVPVAYVLYLSTTRWLFSRTTAPVWIGLGNYVEVLTQPRFHVALANTLLYAALAVTVQIPLGMAIALVFNMNFAGRGIVRTLFLFPMMSTPLASMFAWRLLLDAHTGLPQLITNALGVLPIALLGGSVPLVPVLILVDTWQWTPFVTLILLAGLQALPIEPYESASMDGASEWQSFWYLTVPLMRWSIAVAALFRLIDSLKAFETIYILAPGASMGGRGAETLNMYAFREALEYYHMGYASALVVVFFLIIFSLGTLVLRLRRGAS